MRDYILENNITEEQYAMMVHMQVSDRMPKYMEDEGSAKGIKEALEQVYHN